MSLAFKQVCKKPTSKKSKKKVILNLIDEQNLHPVAKAMIKLQLHTPKAPYTEEEASLSQQLFYYSASALRRLRKAGCNFPSQRTIRRWHEEYNMMPGFCDFIFSKLQEKIAKLPAEERMCALKWDEMSIKSYEEYSLRLDEVEGLVDLGPLGRKNERAKCVFVFCLDSINARHPWRQPLAYFLPGKCMKAEEIIQLLEECLDRLSKTGADVRIVTCDQGTSNQSAYNQLGVHADKPYFIYKGKKYYASFDFPHLVKRLTSLLRRYKYLYCDGKVIASYADFEMTWSIDNAAAGGSNLLSHITEAHIHPNAFEAMNVKRAFQLFSNKFAAAMKTAGYGKELQTDTWEATADFTERMNNVIDACNSYSFNMKFGGKRLLSNNNPDIENLLTDCVKWCSRWSTSPEKVLQIPCLKGFCLTINAILGTYNDIKMQNDTFELATGLCNQDSVEHLFSKLRQRSGFNPNPTARMVRLSFRHILCTGYIHTSDRGNVQCPEANCLINPPTKLTKAIENCMSASHNGVQYDIDPEDESFLEDVNILQEYDNIESCEHISSFDSYDQNAIAFFAGYVARKSIEKTKCDKCRNIMMKTPMDDTTANEKYIEFREYLNPDEDAPIVTKLVRPTTLFAKVLEIQLQAFNRTYERNWASAGIVEKITQECINLTMHSKWLDENEPCYKHRVDALKYLIRVKIYSRTRYNNRAGKRGDAPNRKMKKLLNK